MKAMTETVMTKRILTGFLGACGCLAAGAAMAGGASTSGDMHMAGDMHMSGNMHMGAASTTLQVSDCWIRALPSPAPSAGYFVVRNTGTRAATLTGAASPAFGMVMLHKSIESGGMSKMVMEHDIPVPAGGMVTFKPGSYHAMLEKPKQKLVVGSKLELDLQFASGEMARSTCVVKPAGALSR